MESAHSLLADCHFQTDRLEVDDWDSQAIRYQRLGERGGVVASLFTSSVTQWLLPDWQGDYDGVRGESWFRDREAEGRVLVAVEPENSQVVGLLLLFASEADDTTDVEIRLGYIVDEKQAGRGLATELVGGLVVWCRSQPAIRFVRAGVSSAHAASIRVLAKNGFEGAPSVDRDEFEMVLTLD